MNVKDLETRSGMTRANIRYYEQEGLLTPARRENQYRDYSESDLETLLRIKLLRRLGFSIDEIRRLQSGELDFAEAMRHRGAALETEGRELFAARRLCSDLADAVTSYSALQPELYLDRMEHPHTVEQGDVPEPHPWRRYFARTIDLALVGLPVSLVQFVLLRCMPNDSVWAKALVGWIGWALLILIEPLLLSRCGTTAGKWCMGVRVTRPDGSYLSFGEAFSRTVTVWAYGVGLSLPLVELICMILSYRRCSKGEMLAWEEDSVEHFDERGMGKMAALYLGCTAAATALSVLMIVSVLLPPCRGALSVADFAENFNYYCRQSDRNGAWQLDETGAWTQENDMYTVYINAARPTDFTYTVENGALRAVHWAYSAEGGDSFSVDMDDARMAYLALAAAQPETSLFNIRSLMNTVSEEKWPADRSCHQDWRGVSMDYTADVDGVYFYNSGFFFPDSSTSVSLRFDAYVNGAEG